MKQKKIYLSLARVLCAFAVVVIHTNTCYLEFNLNDCWVHSNILECGLGFAVPIFLMITGATLMDYSDRYSTKDYFKKRFLKTLIPFIAWTIIGCIYESYTGNEGVFIIYFFFLNLFGVYLSIPLFSLLRPSHKAKVITYIVVLSFILNYLLPFIGSLINFVNPFVIPFEVGDNYLIYPLTGYLISRKRISLKWRIGSYILAILGFVLHIGGTYYFSVKAGEIVHVFKGYLNVPAFLMAVGVFVLIKEIGSKLKQGLLSKVIDWLSEYTLSVFLLHYYIIKEVIEPLFINTHSLVYKIGTPFLTFAICVIIAWGIKKVPIVRRILP